MPSSSISLLAVLAALGLLALAGTTDAAGTKAPAAPTVPVNKFYARYSYPPLDPNQKQGYWVMPRTVSAALKDKWAAVAGPKRADRTTLYLRDKDYRVGLLFDERGSVAGAVISVSLADVKTSKTPFPFAKSDEWFQQKLLGVDVYSTVSYFVSKQTLAAGGRPMTDATPTAPQIELLRVKPGMVGQQETGRKRVGNSEAALHAEGWNTQGCFLGQGFHSYEGLSEKTTCDKLRTYFPITHPKSHTLTALGVTIWSRSSDNGPRPWLEEIFSKNLKNIVIFHAPQCMWDNIDKYGLYTIHLFFNDKPWTVPCK